MQIGWTAVRTIAIRLVHFRGNDGLARLKLHEQAAEIIENRLTVINRHTAQKCAP